MKKKLKIVLPLLVLLGLVIVLLLRLLGSHNHVEIQVRETRESPDRRWTAVVQMEIYNAGGIVNDAVYAVRLKKADQMASKGDLVMNIPVNYPDPEPYIAWSNNNLVVTLAPQQKYQYFATPIDGVAIVVLHK